MQSTLRRTKLKGWFEYYREICPVCGKSGGCMINEKGDTVVCIRTESPIVFSQNFQSWIHRLEEKQTHDLEGMQQSIKTNKKVSSNLLDFVYRALLDCTTLQSVHHRHLTNEKRKMKDDEISIRGYRSFPDKPWESVKGITKQIGYQRFPGIPGFFENQYGWTLAGFEGIMIPYRNEYNEIVGFQIRVDNPLNDVEINRGTIEGLKARVKQPNVVQAFIDGEIIFEKSMELGQIEDVTLVSQSSDTPSLHGTVKLVKGQRYFWFSSGNKQNGTGAGDPSPVHVAVPTSQLKSWENGELLKCESVWLTEGALKADISAEHIANVYKPEELQETGTTVLAVPGVNTWRTVMPVLENMGVKHVNIAFDMDVMTNPHVEYYLKELAIELKNKEYSANLVIWNEQDGKGIDDVLINRRLPQFRKLF